MTTIRGLPLLAKNIESYRAGKMTAEQFQDWFEAGCSSSLYESESILRSACGNVESAFLSLIVGDSDEDQLKEELPNAIPA